MRSNNRCLPFKAAALWREKTELLNLIFNSFLRLSEVTLHSLGQNILFHVDQQRTEWTKKMLPSFKA